MITQLRFKNWRSLKDVTIDDLGKITVFIGANSSGKTNILEGLRFLSYVENNGMLEAVFQLGGRTKIQLANSSKNAETEIGISMMTHTKSELLTQVLAFQFHGSQLPAEYKKYLRTKNRIITKDDPIRLPNAPRFSLKVFPKSDTEELDVILSYYMESFLQTRLQVLNENFIPPISISANISDASVGNFYRIDPNARNVLFVLDFMRQSYSLLFEKLQQDLSWILNHIDKIEVQRTEREIELSLTETYLQGQLAPSISAGTLRLIAMLTAIYQLDMDTRPFDIPFFGLIDDYQISHASMPGLVVIEEPDMGLNPGVLRRFVEQLRNYVDGPNPRQIIMTTHNPSFLDYFESEEVRVVERDEQGYTTVNKIPDYIKEIWLKDGEYGLGEVWQTRSFGGVPE